MVASTGTTATCAAAATATASATGRGAPHRCSRSAQVGAITTRAAVAATDITKPGAVAQAGRTISRPSTAAASAGRAWRRRPDTSAYTAINPISAARSTLGAGRTTITKPTVTTTVTAARPLGPRERASAAAAAHTSAKWVPETAVRWVSPAIAN